MRLMRGVERLPVGCPRAAAIMSARERASGSGTRCVDGDNSFGAPDVSTAAPL